MKPKALLSVSNKDGLVSFARSLINSGYELLSTGGTASSLREAGLAVCDVSEYTGFPEIMDGRVKTLHPKIHGGILGRRGGTDDLIMQEQGIGLIDMVVVNLYPFRDTISQPDCTYDLAIENIDVGGPAMIRAAAKNHRYVTVVTDSKDYAQLEQMLEATGETTLQLRAELAAKAFQHTAIYDAVIATYLSGQRPMEDRDDASLLPDELLLVLSKQLELRYGENPHQQAVWYKNVADAANSERAGASLSDARSIQGKALSFNNIADADAALGMAREFTDISCVIVKHANPCGVATAGQAVDAYQMAYRCDPTSAFGGIIAINSTIDGTTAQAIVDNQFVEVLIAQSFSDDALAILATKPAIRVLEIPAPWTQEPGFALSSVGGGYLMQSVDDLLLGAQGCTVVTARQPEKDEVRDLMFAWKVAKHVKSNAIVYAHNNQTVGIGAGQMSRVYSARIAAIKAADEGLVVKGCALASDAFFPFRDGIDQAAAAGVRSVIQPGGSRNDEEVIAAADEHGIAMMFTGMRHFRH